MYMSIFPLNCGFGLQHVAGGRYEINKCELGQRPAGEYRRQLRRDPEVLIPLPELNTTSQCSLFEKPSTYTGFSKRNTVI